MHSIKGVKIFFQLKPVNPGEKGFYLSNIRAGAFSLNGNWVNARKEMRFHMFIITALCNNYLAIFFLQILSASCFSGITFAQIQAYAV
jgi:hypothetical protein